MAIDFHMNFDPPPFDQKIRYGDQLFLIGSCFTNHLYDRFHLHKFHVAQNPHGILFNPVSIFHSIDNYIRGKQILEQELFFDQGLWHHWDFHSAYSHENRQEALLAMNHQVQHGKTFLEKSNWIFITLGSAFVYKFQDEKVVANCHKIPADQFKRKMLDPSIIKHDFFDTIHRLRSMNP